jgi:hypothetical protein
VGFPRLAVAALSSFVIAQRIPSTVLQHALAAAGSFPPSYSAGGRSEDRLNLASGAPMNRDLVLVLY